MLGKYCLITMNNSKYYQEFHLQSLENKFTSDPASADVSYEIANVYFEKGNKYSPLQSDENKWMKKQALELCEAIIKKFPSSDGAQNCQALKGRIVEHTVDFMSEKVNLPNAPSRALITYTDRIVCVSESYVSLCASVSPSKYGTLYTSLRTSSK